MKNLLAANIIKDNKRSREMKKVLQAQIHNSLDVGWEEKDIIVICNFDFEYMGVKSIKVDLNKTCLTGTKLFATKYVFENNMHEGQVVWSHDLDAWQNHWFQQPYIQDVGATYYAKPKFNGGSIFWKDLAIDIISNAIDIILENEEAKEEPTLNELFKNEYKERVTVVNNTYNVGCSGYVSRYMRSELPIKVSHFHPFNRIAWETHRLNRDGVGLKSVDFRLEKILRQYYPGLPFLLSEEGRNAQSIKAEKNYNKIQAEEYLVLSEDVE